ncbi:hypothetical protein POM88_052708 [Heracleum sosnowskyi]|uniref:Uncharacterized protein n=1 Tax=Heracleum sosnowskyi TaxID=360622 RepID=A0AAD8GRI7_9APIA|nr:hypothetical protein POM88_052708 [Heracleum sosnowskyi]
MVSLWWLMFAVSLLKVSNFNSQWLQLNAAPTSGEKLVGSIIDSNVSPDFVYGAYFLCVNSMFFQSLLKLFLEQFSSVLDEVKLVLPAVAVDSPDKDSLHWTAAASPPPSLGVVLLLKVSGMCSHFKAKFLRIGYGNLVLTALGAWFGEVQQND